jgi:hypothetical protein
VGVGAARHDAEAFVREARRERAGVADDPLGVVPELRLHRLFQRDGLAGDVVLDRATLHHREHGLVDRLRVLLGAQDHRSTRPAERLVRGERHDVGVRDRARERPTGHEADEV